MENQFIPYELAVKLKGLGFDEDCLASYMTAGRVLDICEYVNHGQYSILAPLWQQAFDWFRQEKVMIYFLNPCLWLVSQCIMK